MRENNFSFKRTFEFINKTPKKNERNEEYCKTNGETDD